MQRAAHRDPATDLQLEVCDACGNLYPRRRLVVVHRAHLGEVTVCDDCYETFSGYSFADYRASSQTPLPEAPRRLPPTTGSKIPWED